MIDFFLKLFKAFNSSQTPWQMSLALSMGMAMGLTPYSGIQTIILIFLALIINIHIGLFLVSSTFFAGLAYLLDPYFEHLGYLILNAEGLKELFTYMYNSGLLRLTYFNNTIVMGSSIVAFSLLLPMFFILNMLVYIYRDKIASKLQNYAILRKLGIEVSDKKDKLFRVWGIGAFAFLGGGIALFGIFFLDSLVKGLVETNLSKALEKRVSIEDLDISFKEAKIELNNLNIVDTKKVVLHTQNINLDIDFNQVLFQRYHIENINVSGMSFDTPLQVQEKISTGVAKSHTKEKKERGKKEEGFKLPSLSLEDPQLLVERAGLLSVSSYESAQKDIQNISTKYKDAIEKDFSKSEADKIKQEIKDLQKRIKSKDLKEVLALKKDIESLKKKLKMKKSSLKTLKKQFKEDKQKIKNHYQDLKNSAQADYTNLAQNYKLNKDGGVNVVGVLFGEKIKNYLHSSLEYYEMAKPYLKSEDEPKEVVVPRGEGRWIRYKENIPSVDLWIKKIYISGVASEQAFTLDIQDLSSDQKLLNKATQFNYKSDGAKFKNLRVTGEDSHLAKNIKTTASYGLDEADVKDADLSFMRLQSAKYSLKGTLDVEDYHVLDSQTKVLFTKASLSLKKTDNDFMEGVGDILQKIDSFDLKVKLGGTITNPRVDVRSNLDKKLSSAFSKVLNKEVQKYKQELKVLIDQKLQKQLKDLGLKEGELSGLDDLFDSKTKTTDILKSRVDNLEQELKDKTNQEIQKQKKILQEKADRKKEAAEKKAKEKAKKEADKLLKSLKF